MFHTFKTNLIFLFVIDYFDQLSDEVVLQIFSWLGKRHLITAATVCRRFNRLIRDESLWTRMDISCKYLEPGELGRFLSRQVVVLRLARSEVIYFAAFCQVSHKIQVNGYV